MNCIGKCANPFLCITNRKADKGPPNWYKSNWLFLQKEIFVRRLHVSVHRDLDFVSFYHTIFLWFNLCYNLMTELSVLVSVVSIWTHINVKYFKEWFSRLIDWYLPERLAQHNFCHLHFHVESCAALRKASLAQNVWEILLNICKKYFFCLYLVKKKKKTLVVVKRICYNWQKILTHRSKYL